MSEWNISVVLIVPADHKDAANALGDALGWGPESYTVALSADGSGPATHYGCRALVTQDFVDLLANPSEEALAAGAADILAVLVHDIQVRADGAAHFEQVITMNGLSLVESP